MNLTTDPRAWALVAVVLIFALLIWRKWKYEVEPARQRWLRDQMVVGRPPIRIVRDTYFWRAEVIGRCAWDSDPTRALARWFKRFGNAEEAQRAANYLAATEARSQRQYRALAGLGPLES